MEPGCGEAEHGGKVSAMTVLTGGGFKLETKCLLPKLSHAVSLHVLRTEHGGMPGQDGVPPGRHQTVPMFATVTRPSKWRSLRAFVITFSHALAAIHRYRIRLVFGIGCSHIVPMLLAARLSRCKTTYIESITRADTLSMTGRIVYRLRLADTFIVQWPELQRIWPRAVVSTIL